MSILDPVYMGSSFVLYKQGGVGTPIMDNPESALRAEHVNGEALFVPKCPCLRWVSQGDCLGAPGKLCVQGSKGREGKLWAAFLGWEPPGIC